MTYGLTILFVERAQFYITKKQLPKLARAILVDFPTKAVYALPFRRLRGLAPGQNQPQAISAHLVNKGNDSL